MLRTSRGCGGVPPRAHASNKSGQLTDCFLPYCWQAIYIQRFMHTLPNTTIPIFDFNLPHNFNPRALAKLLVCVFPINNEPFFYGNMYPILEKLKEGGVKLLWHRAFNTLDGLTGYTIKEGSEDALIRIAEYWGFNFEHYDDFDESSFTAVQPATSSVAGPSSSNA